MEVPVVGVEEAPLLPTHPGHHPLVLADELHLWAVDLLGQDEGEAEESEEESLSQGTYLSPSFLNSSRGRRKARP